MDRKPSVAQRSLCSEDASERRERDGRGADPCAWSRDRACVIRAIARQSRMHDSRSWPSLRGP